MAAPLPRHSAAAPCCCVMAAAVFQPRCSVKRLPSLTWYRILTRSTGAVAVLPSEPASAPESSSWMAVRLSGACELDTAADCGEGTAGEAFERPPLCADCGEGTAGEASDALIDFPASCPHRKILLFSLLLLLLFTSTWY